MQHYSLLAKAIAKRYRESLDEAPGMNCVAAAADAELQEVRELVELIARPKFTTDEKGHIQYYVTKSDVEAARTLYAKLQVKE